MGMFCSKKKLKKEIENLIVNIKRLDDIIKNQKLDISNKEKKIIALHCENDALKEKNACLKHECEKYSVIISNDDLTINSLNEKISEQKMSIKKLASRIGGLNSTLVRKKKEYTCELSKATKLINELNEENKKLKSRPTVEELKMERVSISHENKKRIKK